MPIRKLTDRESELLDQLGIEYYKLLKELKKIEPKQVASKLEISEQYVYKRWSKLNDSREINATST